MGRIKREIFGLDGPSLADELMGCEAFECLQPAAEIVGGDEVCEVALELIVAVVVVALDRCFLERAIPPLDLAVGPWMFWLGGAVVDIGHGASELKGMRTELFSFRKACLMSGTTEPPAPGVVKWMPLSVSTMWILYGTVAINRRRQSPAVRCLASR
jgi:hypothetical protein